MLTEREVRLTGFPRHDRLLELAAAVAEPDLVLVDPTPEHPDWGVVVAPSMRERLAAVTGLPVRVLAAGTDPAELLARAVLVVTGRPWVACDAGYLDRPVIGFRPEPGGEPWPTELGPDLSTVDDLPALAGALLWFAPAHRRPTPACPGTAAAASGPTTRSSP